MATATASRSFEVPAETVREAILTDVPAFIRASGFDSLTVEGDTYTVSRDIGLATFELTLERLESEHLLEFEQIEGMFDRMWTEYRLEGDESGCELVATTEFTLGGVLAPILDGTMIETQRHGEFDNQFDYVSSAIESSADGM